MATGEDPEPKPRCVVCHASYARGERFCPLDGGAIVIDGAAADDGVVGKTIDGRYLVRRFVGKGGMGAVYEAEHVGLDKRVAIKFVSAADADRDLRARFRQEARAASRVVDEHVVQVYDVGADGDRDFIVMEFVEGRHLGEVLAQGPLEPARAIEIARQLLAGLHAIHAAGIVHRDIKPANILLADRQPDFVKIMDFGIAKSVRGDVAQTDTGTGRFVGTPQYMAPEQLADGEVDRRADLYAVGVTMYAMVTGGAPFAGGSLTAVVDAKVRPVARVDTVRPGLAPALAAVIARAMETAPDRRFPDALAFAAALARVAADPAEPAGPVEPPEREAAANAPEPVEAPAPARDGVRTVVVTRKRAREPGARPWRWIVAAVALVAVAIVGYLAWPRAAPVPAATTAAPAVDRLALARAAEQRGELATAIGIYLEAYAAEPAADVLYRLGDLYERIDDRPRAATYLRRYLDAAPAAADRDVILARIARLEATPPPAAQATPPDAAPLHVARPKPPRPPRGGSPECLCNWRMPDRSITQLCPRKARRPHCLCYDADRQWLCAVPFSIDDGSTQCLDTSRPECRDQSTAPSSCQLVYSTTGVATGDACAGYTASGNKGTGTYACDWCDWSQSDEMFHGTEGEACTGYYTYTGERRTGTLARCGG